MLRLPDTSVCELAPFAPGERSTVAACEREHGAIERRCAGAEAAAAGRGVERPVPRGACERGRRARRRQRRLVVQVLREKRSARQLAACRARTRGGAAQRPRVLYEHAAHAPRQAPRVRAQAASAHPRGVGGVSRRPTSSRCARRGISPAGAREYTNNDSRYRYRRYSPTLTRSGVRWLPRCRPRTQTVLAGTELHDACSTRPEHDASEAGGRYRELRHVRAWHQRDGILDRGEGMV